MPNKGAGFYSLVQVPFHTGAARLEDTGCLGSNYHRVRSFSTVAPCRYCDQCHGPDVLPYDDVAADRVSGMVHYMVEDAAMHCTVEVAASLGTAVGLVVVPVA